MDTVTTPLCPGLLSFANYYSLGLVPAIILPKGFPNQLIFNFFHQHVPPELSAALITLRDDYFEDAGVLSYYDVLPVSVHQTHQIFLSPTCPIKKKKIDTYAH